MINIKNIERSTLQEVADIHQRSWDDTYSNLIAPDYRTSRNKTYYLKKWIRWHDRNQNGLVAYFNGKAAGFITFGDRTTPQIGDKYEIVVSSSEIYALYILPEMKGKGIGTALFLATLDQLIASRKKSTMLWVLTGNTEGLEYYMNKGGEVVGQRSVQIGGEMHNETAVKWSNIERTRMLLTHRIFPQHTP